MDPCRSNIASVQTSVTLAVLTPLLASSVDITAKWNDTKSMMLVPVNVVAWPWGSKGATSSRFMTTHRQHVRGCSVPRTCLWKSKYENGENNLYVNKNTNPSPTWFSAAQIWIRPATNIHTWNTFRYIWAVPWQYRILARRSISIWYWMKNHDFNSIWFFCVQNCSVSNRS